MGTAKKNVEALLSRLPEDCSLEDIQYHLYVLEKVRRGIESAETQPTFTQDQAEARLHRWLTE
jgi:hypothetical protein